MLGVTFGQRGRVLLVMLTVIGISGCLAVDDREYRACLQTMTAIGTGAGVASGGGGAAVSGGAIGSAAAMTLCREPEKSGSLEPPALLADTTTAVLSDADGDGVDDGSDRCNDTPGGIAVDELGCSSPLVFDSRLLNFAFDSADLPADARPVLGAAVSFISEHPEAVFQVVGHTDSQGTDDYNLALSLRRARAVRDALVGLGVPAGRLEVSGMGERESVATNQTETGQARNRRVEVALKPDSAD